MSYMKQNKNRKQTLDSARYGLEIILSNLRELQSHEILFNSWYVSL